MTVSDNGSYGALLASVLQILNQMSNGQNIQYNDLIYRINQLGQQVDDDYYNFQELILKHAVQDHHEINKTQVGLWHVNNYETAVGDLAKQFTRDDLYLTPQGLSTLIDELLSIYNREFVQQGSFPFSRYGNNTFIPPGIYGSFEGASGYSDGYSAGIVMNLEQDGTLTGLREGTNGITRGIYYFYKPNFLKNLDGVQAIRTNYKYMPPGIPVGNNITNLISGGNDDVFLMRIGNNATYNCAVALTYGTLDMYKHKVALFIYPYADPGTVFDQGPHLASIHPFISNGYVYVAAANVINGVTGGTPVPPSIMLFRMKITDIEANSAVTPEVLYNWTYTNIYGESDTSKYIQLAKVGQSANLSDKPYIQITGTWPSSHMNHSQVKIIATENPNNSEEIRLAFTGNLWFTAPVYANFGNTINLTYVWDMNPNARTATLINPSSNPGPVKLLADDTAKTATYDLTIAYSAYVQNAAFVMTGMINQGNYYPHLYQTRNGYLVTRMIGQAADNADAFNVNLLTDKITGEVFTSIYDSLNLINRRPVAISNYPYMAGVAEKLVLGSNIGSNLMTPRLLSNTRMMINCQSTQPSVYSYGLPVYFDIVGDATGSGSHTYNFFGGSTYNGYQPYHVREIPKDYTTLASMPCFNGMVCYHDAATTTTNVWGTTLCLTGNSDSNPDSKCYNTWNPDLTSSGVCTYNLNEIIALKEAVIAAATSSFVGTVTTNGTVLYIPQVNDCPAIGVVSVDTFDGSVYHLYQIIFFANVTVRTGAISGLSLDKIIHTWDRGTSVRQGLGLYASFGLTLYKCVSGDYIFGACSYFGLVTTSGTLGSVWYGMIRANDIVSGTVYPLSALNGYFPSYANYTPIVVPGHGFAMTNDAAEIATSRTATILNVIATDYASYMTWTANINTAIATVVAVSQEVEQGWVVYFTEDINVTINGIEYYIQHTNQSLTNVVSDPSNKTFYIYIQVDLDDIEYFISLDKLPDTNYRLYIGYLETNSTQITNIEVEKVTSFGNYRISPHLIGNAISVSTGNPATNGNWYWKDENFLE